jgi:hypothetical protein
VQWQLGRIAASPGVILPSLDAACQGFELMGNRPEELLKALLQLQANYAAPPDQAIPIICATLATAAADVELRALDDLGPLAQAIYGRIAAGKEEGISGLFSADALADYAQRTGAAVETTRIQALAAKLVAANLIARQGHGVYAVADPFVRKVWVSKAILGLSVPAKPMRAGARTA